jgi:hypothetical protein
LKKYKYYLLHRPLDIGTAPNDFIESSSFGIKQRVLKDGTEAWGTVTYDRKLTDEEVKKFELLEAISEEKKQEAIKDIQNLDRIYKDLIELPFNDKSINILMDKMSTLINKEIVKQLSKSDITHKEYEEIVDKNILISMNKEEAIRYYADKIVYDCITDCTENNRIFSVDEYKNNNFIVENFAEIVKRINLDEKVNDMEVDLKKKEIDFIFYLEYCPHYYQDDLDISNKERIEHLEGFKNYISDYKAITPSRWFRTNTREAIQGYYYNERMYDENKDVVYNLLREELNKIGFVNKYLDGYNVTINVDNVDELINQLEERINELKITLEEGEIENE